MTKADPLAPFLAAAETAIRTRDAVRVLRALNGVGAVAIDDLEGTANHIALTTALQKLTLGDFLALLDRADGEGDAAASPDHPDETSIPERLKSVRSALLLSQAAMAETYALSTTAWQSYEHGRHLPGGEILARLVDSGFSADWILTGRGQMRLATSEG